MKLLSEPEIVALLDLDKVDLVERALPPLDDADTDRRSQGWLKRGVAEGFFTAGQIVHEGRTIASVIYSQALDPGRVLHVNAILALVSDDISITIQAAVERLAREMNCPVIEFQTRRCGMVQKTKRFGWKLHAVVLRKYL
jgi:phosphohistidine swiveling domain-containing protein